MQDILDQLAGTVREAAARRSPLRIRGGGTKDFYGSRLEGEILDMRAYAGIVDYEPTELVITARAGTPLAEVESVMQQHGQMLAFEPPRFAQGGTLGGCIAAGLSGPRRPYAGAARDFVLGVRMLDGKGIDLKFGGQVMKNVAGYDVSRLMVGSLGTLGVITEISLKVLPQSPAEITLVQEHGQQAAIDLMNTLAGKPYPISATCHFGSAVYVRLSGAEPAVRAARLKLGGEEMSSCDRFWEQVRDQTLPFFAAAGSLWRVSLKSTTPALLPEYPQLVEWSGALRWVSGVVEPSVARKAAEEAGGHATVFRESHKAGDAFHPLSPPLSKIHRRLKETFDPSGILNPGRMYSTW